MLKICLLWALLVPAPAQVYKWVDERGVTHYGERPPQGKTAKEVEQRLANPGPAPGKAVQPDWKEQNLEFNKRRIESERREARNKAQQDSQRLACKQASDRLAMLKSARGVFRLDEKGERVYQSDDERIAATAQLEQLVVQHCR